MLDVERPAVQDDVGFDAHAARALGRNEGCAATGSAGHGDAATPFPNPHADLGGRPLTRRKNLREFDVAPVRELLVAFQHATPVFQLDFFDVVHENDRVRISHRDGLRGEVVAVGGELDGPEEVPRVSHVHAHAAVVQELGLHEPALGVQVEYLGVGRFREPAAADVFRHAARCVPAHGGFGAVGVEYAHLEVGAVGLRFGCGSRARGDSVHHEAAFAVHRGHDDHAVGAYAEAAVAKLDNALGKFGAEARAGIRPVIQILTRFQ